MGIYGNKFNQIPKENSLLEFENEFDNISKIFNSINILSESSIILEFSFEDIISKIKKFFKIVKEKLENILDILNKNNLELDKNIDNLWKIATAVEYEIKDAISNSNKGRTVKILKNDKYVDVHISIKDKDKIDKKFICYTIPSDELAFDYEMSVKNVSIAWNLINFVTHRTKIEEKEEFEKDCKDFYDELIKDCKDNNDSVKKVFEIEKLSLDKFNSSEGNFKELKEKTIKAVETLDESIKTQNQNIKQFDDKLAFSNKINESDFDNLKFKDIALKYISLDINSDASVYKEFLSVLTKYRDHILKLKKDFVKHFEHCINEFATIKVE